MPLCDGDYECPAGSTCVGGADGALGCVAVCDPFAPQCPSASETCIYTGPLYAGQALCVTDNGFPTMEGGECFGTCGPGLARIFAESLGPERGFEPCCTALCDERHACSAPGQVWGVCFCIESCSDASECPTPQTRNAELVCNSACLLSCTDGQTCPNGMVCDTELYPGLCLWGVELEPGCSAG